MNEEQVQLLLAHNAEQTRQLKTIAGHTRGMTAVIVLMLAIAILGALLSIMGI